MDPELFDKGDWPPVGASVDVRGEVREDSMGDAEEPARSYGMLAPLVLFLREPGALVGGPGAGRAGVKLYTSCIMASFVGVYDMPKHAV